MSQAGRKPQPYFSALIRRMQSHQQQPANAGAAGVSRTAIWMLRRVPAGKLLAGALLAIIAISLSTIPSHAQVINYPSGFSGSSGKIWLENFATLDGSMIHLVPSKVHNGSNAWFETPENVQAFSTTFTFHIDCSADPSDCGGGFGFMMICNCMGGNPVYNPSSGQPGYTYSGYSGAQFSWSQCESPLTPASQYCGAHSGSNLTQLPDNIIVTFNNYYNGNPGYAGASLTTYATNGAFPAAPVTAENNMAPSGINLNSGHLFSATLTYDGSTLTESLTDTVTGANYTHQYAANIPAAITGNTAFIGFGGGTGAALDDVYIHSWTYTAQTPGSSSSTSAASPTFSPGAGAYTAAQSVKIADSTSGATVYYTTDGSTPTTSSSKYSNALAVNSSTTLKAVAVASGGTSSSVSSASYTIGSSTATTATPTFSPGGGTYTSAQAVKIADATTGATIYYTTDGSTPSTSSQKYTGAITVGSTETLKAIGVASGNSNSSASSATYTISPASGPSTASGGTVINYPNGFSGSPSTIASVNSASYSGSSIQLTSASPNQSGNVYFKTPVNVQGFTTTFTWTSKCPGGSGLCGDGMGFEIISTSNPKSPAYWSGGSGGSLSWASGCSGSGTGCEHINSVFVKFDLYNVSTGSGTANLTGLYTGGQYPQPPNTEYNMASSGINMQSGHLMRATLTYNGTTLYETVTDTVTNSSYSNNYTVNIPSQVGGNTALVGFGGASGAASVQQNIDSWTYTVQTPATAVSKLATAQSAAATPTFSPTVGAYNTAQSVTLLDTTPGATIYFTTNGTSPTSSSAKYTGPIKVNSSETLQAIAVAPEYGNSSVASADYTIKTSSSGPQTAINFPNGFSDAPPVLATVNDAFFSGTSIQLTSAKDYEAGNAYFKTPVNVQAFSTTFTWTEKCPGGGVRCGDGMGFVMMAPTNPKSPGYWVGGTGSNLSWSDCSSSSNCATIPSVFVKFSTYNAASNSDKANLTGVYSGGQWPQPPNPEYDMSPSGINMQTGHLMRAVFTYNGTTLYETVTDTVTNNTYTNHYTVNIPALIGGNTALVGFAGATGTSNAQQNIESWTYTNQ